MRVFGVDYTFLSCGDVFTRGLEHAAKTLGLDYLHDEWSSPNINAQVVLTQPDLLFVVHGRRFRQAWGSSTRFDVRRAVWLVDEPYEVDDTERFSAWFNHVFVNDRATLHRHPGSIYLPVCYDPRVHYWRTEQPRWRSVGFIGGANGRREAVLAALSRANLLNYVIGGQWSDPDVNRRCLSPNIPAPLTADFYRETKIVVNVFREQHHFNRDGIVATAMNPRIYEALACGALVVSEPRSEIAERVPELPTFTTPDECVELVRGLLAEPDRLQHLQTVCAARLSGDTYAARLRKVMQAAMGEVAA